MDYPIVEITLKVPAFEIGEIVRSEDNTCRVYPKVVGLPIQILHPKQYEKLNPKPGDIMYFIDDIPHVSSNLL